MTRMIQVRNLPTRIACRVRAGVFLVGALGWVAGVQAQKPRLAPPPPKRSVAPPPRPAAGPAMAPAPHPYSPLPAARPATPPAAAQAAPLVSLGHPAQSEQHLADWMQAHRNMSLEQQHQALENEPGFRQQAPQEQQRMHQRLNQLNRMDPSELNRKVHDTEVMERFAPAQRQQVRNVLGQFGSLPEDRKLAVKRAYLQLRDMPEQQRQAYMNSPQFRGQFNDQERATVGNMVNSAPLLRQFEIPASVPKD